MVPEREREAAGKRYVRNYPRHSVADLSAVLSKKQYESGVSTKATEKKQDGSEANKVCHDTLPHFVPPVMPCSPQLKRDRFAGLTRRAKRRKMTMEEDETDQKVIGASIRGAKKAMRPTKIGMPEARTHKVKAKKSRGEPKKQKSSNSFDRDLGQRTKTEGIRAKKGDSVGRAGKRPRKSR